MLAAGSSSNSVVQALHLFQTNPNVQSAVKSIASDPAVWRAVLSNEKVKELTQNLRGGYEIPPLTISVINEEPEVSAFKKFTTKVCDFLQGKILQILNKVAEIVSSMFSSVEKTFFSKDSEIDKTVASCLMLAVAVLLVVYVKRVGK
ncbi:hypothetical protein KP509_04G078600 [Ceratopteris richardii]|nr:hypothetical protein KP509_04G078600 [Ceratopteris richardii]